jgi:nucleotidyltransferase/DNA polymerase involved in DNA repair
MGVSFTRWLAKFGGDTAPKAGLVILSRENLFNYLKGRALTEAWGIGEPTAERLQALGITTLDALARYPVMNLKEVMGIRGYELWANVNGIEMRGLERERTPKSIGHSHVLRKRTRDINFHKSVIMRLCERTGRRLRDLGLEGHGVFAHASLEKRGGIGGSKKVFEPITSTRNIYTYVWNMLKDGVTHDTATFYALGLFRLRPISKQLSLFIKPKPEQLIRALDEINSRYGEEVIAQGELATLDKYHAPDRIGFRKTVGLDV